MELPIQGIALELFISEVKEEVSNSLLRRRSSLDPVVRAVAQLQITRNLVELAPLRSNRAEPTLARKPRFVIHIANPITPGIAKTDVAALSDGELRELPWIERELQNEIRPIHPYDRSRRVGLRV